ncbi:MAG: hypothetical protein PF637_06125 [Spirochaetes bacterium]|jgi:hypothetical protein|nr:hypothetical protein [Spirochaetota bacterium]
MKYLLLPVLILMVACGTNQIREGVVDIDAKDTEWRSGVVSKNLSSVPVGELRSELEMYYEGEPYINIVSLGSNSYMVHAGLGERKWSKQFDVEMKDTSIRYDKVGSNNYRVVASVSGYEWEKIITLKLSWKDKAFWFGLGCIFLIIVYFTVPIVIRLIRPV